MMTIYKIPLMLSLCCLILCSCRSEKRIEKSTVPSTVVTEGTLIIQIPVSEIAPWNRKLEGLFTHPSISDISIEGYPPEPEIEFVPDSTHLKFFGVTESLISEHLTSTLKDYTGETNLNDLLDIAIKTNDGRVIPLRRLGHFRSVMARSSALYRNDEQVLRVTMQFSGKPIDEIIDTLKLRFEKRAYRGYAQYSADTSKWHDILLHKEN